jgi:hypothetical protein
MSLKEKAREGLDSSQMIQNMAGCCKHRDETSG